MADDELRIGGGGVNVEFVGDAARGQQLVQLLRSLLEAEVVIVADIEINLHALETGHAVGASEVEDVVALEVDAIEGRAEDIATDLSEETANVKQVWPALATLKLRTSAAAAEL